MTREPEILKVGSYSVRYYWHPNSEEMHKVSVESTLDYLSFSYVENTGRIYEWYHGMWRRPTTIPVGAANAIYAISREIAAEKLLGDICE